MSFKIVYSETPVSHCIHSHVYYELLYVAEGSVLIRIRNQEYRADTGSLVFINQFDEHATQTISDANISVITCSSRRHSWMRFTMTCCFCLFSAFTVKGFHTFCPSGRANRASTCIFPCFVMPPCAAATIWMLESNL